MKRSPQRLVLTKKRGNLPHSATESRANDNALPGTATHTIAVKTIKIFLILIIFVCGLQNYKKSKTPEKKQSTQLIKNCRDSIP